MERAPLACPRQGLYAITAERYPHDDRLLAEADAVLAGGARMLQFRDTSGDPAWRDDVARALLARCRQARVPMIVNNDVALARAIGADGVHLGRTDEDLVAARLALGDRAIIGASCYADLGRARAAAAAGATYLAFGSVYPSGSKPAATPCPLEVFAAARPLGLPLVAIGGITAENGGAVLDAGADLLAVIGALFDADDPGATARRFNQLWEERANG